MKYILLSALFLFSACSGGGGKGGGGSEGPSSPEVTSGSGGGSTSGSNGGSGSGGSTSGSTSGSSGGTPPVVTSCTNQDATDNGVVFLNSDSTVTGDKVDNDVSDCLLASNSCNNGYQLSADSKSCEVIPPVVTACSVQDATDNGVTLTNSDSSVTGNKTDNDVSACLLASGSCDNGYQLASDSKSCEVIPPVITACSVQDATDNGVDVSNSDSTIVGNKSDSDVSACLLSSSSCDEGYIIASDGKSCDVHPITLNKKFIDIYTVDPTAPPAYTDGGITPSAGGISASLGGSASVTPGSTPSNSFAVTNDEFGTTTVSLKSSISTNSTLPSLSGTNSNAITTCTLESAVTHNCVINALTFSVTSTSSDLVGLDESTLEVNGLTLTIPVNRYAIKQIVNKVPGTSETMNSPKIFNGELYFSSTNSLGRSKLFKITASDQVIQISNTAGNQNTHDNMWFNLVEFNNKLYFSSANSSNQPKLFSVDTNGNVTQETNTSGNQATQDNIGDIVVCNDEMYFSAHNLNNQSKLFKIDSDNNITQLSNTMNDQNVSDQIQRITCFSNEVYFHSETSLGLKNFKVNNAGVISQVSDTNPSGSDGMNKHFVHGQYLYFVSNTPDPLFKLHRVDSSGVVEKVANVSGNVNNDEYNDFTSFNGELFFTATNALNAQRKLFKVKVNGEVVQVANTSGDNTFMDQTVIMGVFHNHLYFHSRIAGSNWTKLFRMNTLGEITRLSDTVNSLSASDNIGFIGFYNNELYFSSRVPGNFTKLHKIDSDGNISKVLDMRGPATQDTFGGSTIVFNNKLYMGISTSAGQIKIHSIGLE